MKIYGVDFTCAPRRAKAITVAAGSLKKNRLAIENLERLETFSAFEAFLARPGPWIGGFDFPFSLPRQLVRDLGWPADWPRLVAHCVARDRLGFRAVFNAYRMTRPVGSKYVHRATDHPAGSSSPMKLVNPPVALMFHEGAPRLLAAGVHIPALLKLDDSRVALGVSRPARAQAARHSRFLQERYAQRAHACTQGPAQEHPACARSRQAPGYPARSAGSARAKRRRRRLGRYAGCLDLRRAGRVGLAARKIELRPALHRPARRRMDRYFIACGAGWSW